MGALHTTVNEYGEVRTMVFTPTKAHDQFMPVLAQVPHSLRQFGHGDVELVFTDNPRADKLELERAIPSLRHDVIPVPTTTLLPPLSIPIDWDVIDYDSDYRMRMRMNTIMEDLQSLKSPNDHLTVAVDMEWSVDLTAGIHGKVAVMAIAHKNSISLFHVSFEFLA